jgi:hypothetical protein
MFGAVTDFYLVAAGEAENQDDVNDDNATQASQDTTRPDDDVDIPERNRHPDEQALDQ